MHTFFGHIPSKKVFVLKWPFAVVTLHVVGKAKKMLKLPTARIYPQQGVCTLQAIH